MEIRSESNVSRMTSFLRSPDPELAKGWELYSRDNLARRIEAELYRCERNYFCDGQTVIVRVGFPHPLRGI